MLINAQRAEEVRIAIVTDDTLDQYEVAATESGLCRGNIYRGAVANIQPSLDAAFIDYGEERDGLLRADDVVSQAYHKKIDEGVRHPRIDRILQRGQPVLVQVVRDAVGHKGGLVTTNISIAGRYLVLMPYDDVRGVSRKVEDEERQIVKERLAKLELPEGCGVIVRTNALDQPQKTLNRDLNALLRLWKKIRQEATASKGPRLLYSDQDLIVQALRDSLDSSIKEVLVDDDEAFVKARGYMRTFMPRAVNRLARYSERMPLFSKFQLEEQIDRIYQRKVQLPSGGSIVIDGTEALTAIDVNSGRATRGANQEETAFNTNLEAARQSARQLRMRDIGGLIVVDFIDMRSTKHRREVEKTMRESLKDDKARTTTSRLSENGLLEINRQRLKKALQLRTHRPCPTCSGTGNIASPELVGLNLLRRIETRAVTGRLGGVRIELHPELADALQNDRRQELAALEREFDIRVEVVAAGGLHRSEERVEWNERQEKDGDEAASGAAVSAADLAESVGDKPADRPSTRGQPPGQAANEGETPAEKRAAPEKTKTRRRRRGGRKRQKTAPPNGSESTPPAEAEAAPDSTGKTQSSSTGSEKKPAASSRRRRGGRKRKTAKSGKRTGEDSRPEPSPKKKESPATGEKPTEAPVGLEDGGDKAPAKKTRRRRPRRPRKKPAENQPSSETTADSKDPYAY
jgi:ribonuclease E